MNFYARTVGIGLTVALLALSGLLATLFYENVFDHWQDSAPFAISIILTFLALHYLSLTSFGFIRDKKLSVLPVYVRSIPWLYILAAVAFLTAKYYRFTSEKQLLRPLSYDEKVEIMETDLPLHEKLKLLRLEKEVNATKTIWTFENTSQPSREENAVRLSEIYDAFSLKPQVIDKLQPLKSRNIGSNVEITLPFNSRISVPAQNRKVLGFSSVPGVVVMQQTSASEGIQYESVNYANPNLIFEGIPLIANTSENYFADVRIKLKSDGVDLVVAFWKGNNRSITSLGRSVIPFSNHFNSVNKSEIINISWKASAFSFDIIEHHQGRSSEAIRTIVNFL